MGGSKYVYRADDICLGQLGRVAVIGGSEDYTGAPYFSAMASAKLGCDMVRNLPRHTHHLNTSLPLSAAALYTN